MWLPQGVPWDVVAVIEGAMLPIASYGGHWIIERYKSGANGREARRVLESLRRGRTYLVFSGKDRANWDWETSSQIRKRLESGKIDAQEARCDSVADIWRYSKDETLANLIVLGSPIRLPLAEDFLKHLMTEGMLDGLSLRVTDARSTSDYVVKLTNDMSSTSPAFAAGQLRPKLAQGKRFLDWPGILLVDSGQEYLFPQYPCDGDVRPAVFRGYDHGLVIVRTGSLHMGEPQPNSLKVQKLVMIMGFSGPSTLASALAYLSRPALFEPKAEGALLSILEVPIVCDKAEKTEDLRYVPRNSVRIASRFPKKTKPACEIDNLHLVELPELRLSREFNGLATVSESVANP